MVLSARQVAPAVRVIKRPHHGKRAVPGAPVTALLIVAGLAASLSCSHDSYLKVTLLSADMPFTGVTHVDVRVEGGSSGTAAAWLTYVSKEPLSFDNLMAKTLAIAFTPDQTGVVSLQVGVRNGSACLGSGATTTTIKKGSTASVTVVVRHSLTCPTQGDGGVVDGGSDGITFPGCDPAAPSVMCPGNQTCFVNCGTKRGMCVPAGTKGAGERCATNADCMPGTQCFEYTSLQGCASVTRICQKFCNDDVQCRSPGTGGATGAGGGGGNPSAGGGGGGGGQAGAGDGGGGASGASGGAAGQGGNAGNAGSPAGGRGAAGGRGGTSGGIASGSEESACRNPVSCSENAVTAYRTCSFACDPRGDGTVGCPAGLVCFLYRTGTTAQDSPDCGCRGPTRVGMDGASCTSSASCAPGHICNMMAGTQICRRLCKMGSPGDCTATQVCSPLQNNAAFGVCVPGS